ncbi:hypothetical protein GCM10017557_11110 [Streptomyces aurantiacus]|uniref:Uncharacterized protein n=1 Tax=Streptomyces aurantiacus TaxID=47760 RepID=A0A7G1NUM2_9ACTN|nr:hypothetical protein GCM10017557_11110 [Streptomyces aurantiacus]
MEVPDSVDTVTGGRPGLLVGPSGCRRGVRFRKVEPVEGKDPVRVYVTGNHEYYSEAQGWVDLMGELGWEPLRNRHLLLEREGDTLVVAGVDDVTAESSGLAGHRAHLRTYPPPPSTGRTNTSILPGDGEGPSKG